jgi:hypothetical protein
MGRLSPAQLRLLETSGVPVACTVVAVTPAKICRASMMVLMVTAASAFFRAIAQSPWKSQLSHSSGAGCFVG